MVPKRVESSTFRKIQNRKSDIIKYPKHLKQKDRLKASSVDLANKKFNYNGVNYDIRGTFTSPKMSIKRLDLLKQSLDSHKPIPTDKIYDI